MTLKEKIQELGQYIADNGEGSAREQFTLTPSGDTLEIIVVRKRNGRRLVKEDSELREWIEKTAEPYALQGSGRPCPRCGGTGSLD